MPRPPINRRITVRPSHEHWTEKLEQKPIKQGGKKTDYLRRQIEEKIRKSKYHDFVIKEKEKEARKTV